jgi:hypothetical protein
VLPLPNKVEVIVLRDGLQRLLGTEGYSVLVDPCSEMKALASQGKARKQKIADTYYVSCTNLGSGNELQSMETAPISSVDQVTDATLKLFE